MQRGALPSTGVRGRVLGKGYPHCPATGQHKDKSEAVKCLSEDLEKLKYKDSEKLKYRLRPGRWRVYFVETKGHRCVYLWDKLEESLHISHLKLSHSKISSLQWVMLAPRRHAHPSMSSAVGSHSFFSLPSKELCFLKLEHVIRHNYFHLPMRKGDSIDSVGM